MMGCDIHSIAEVKNTEGKWTLVGDVFPLGEFERSWYKKDFNNLPFDWRSYSMFGFLANVRNYSHSEYVSEPKGLPDDSEWLNEYDYDGQSRKEIGEAGGYHSHSWLTVAELIAFDYDQLFWDRRCMKQTGPNSWNGASFAENENEGEIKTYRQHLGVHFFEHLSILSSLGESEDVRVIFWFDN